MIKIVDKLVHIHKNLYKQN